MNEKRSCAGGIAQGDLFGLGASAGVGARQAHQHGAGRGGEYLEICGSQNFEIPDADPRFAELRQIGLPRMWLLVAETVGFDLFLELWRRLTEEGAAMGYARDTNGVRMPSLRDYDSYLRFQRNRYIAALAERGMTPKQVRRAVARNLGEPLDEKHVFKIMQKRATG